VTPYRQQNGALNTDLIRIHESKAWEEEKAHAEAQTRQTRTQVQLAALHKEGLLMTVHL
jgi:hypothetical protein